MTPENDKPAELTYGAALKELQTIVSQIEQPDAVDIDQLEAKVKRAAYLIEICRTKLRGTQDAVNTVLDTLKEPRETPDVKFEAPIVTQVTIEGQES
jgi:exodeoxyribonuclease VII small subunit